MSTVGARKDPSSVFARVLCTETRRDYEKERSAGSLLLMPGPGACVWLSSRTTAESRLDTAETRFCKRAIISRFCDFLQLLNFFVSFVTGKIFSL